MAYGRLAQNAFGDSVAADGTVVFREAPPAELLSPIDYGAMATLPEIGPDIPRGIVVPGSDPCKDCPPKIVYRDRIVEKRVPVPVPGPATTITKYINTSTGQQYDSYADAVADIDSTVLLSPPSSGFGPAEGQEVQDGSGEPEEYSASGEFPWWLIALGIGTVFVVGMKKGR